MKFIYAILLLEIGSLTCQSAYGQERLQLTMEDAILMAQEKSFAAYSNNYSYAVSKLNYLDQKRSIYPSLSFSSTVTDYSRSIQEQWNSEEQRFLPYEVQRLVNSGRFSIDQPVPFTGGSVSVSSGLDRSQTFSEDGDVLYYTSTPIRFAYSQNFSRPNPYQWNIRVGELRFEEAERQRVEDTEVVASKAISQFYELLIAQNQLSIAQLNKSNADSLLWMAREKKAIFAISRADYLNLELQSTNAQIELEKAHNDLENLRFSFSTFLGLPAATVIECMPDGTVDIINIDRELALSKVFENNTDQVAIRRKLLESERSLLEAKRQPYNVNLRASIGLNQNRDNIQDVYQDLLDQQGVALSLSIPIYDGGDNSRRVQRARLAMEYQKREAEQNNIDLEREIIQRINNFEITASQLKAYAKSDTLGYYVYQATKERFILGKANIVDVINAEERRQSARLSYLRQVQNYWTQYYAIRQLCLYDFEKQKDLVSSND